MIFGVARGRSNCQVLQAGMDGWTSESLALEAGREVRLASGQWLGCAAGYDSNTRVAIRVGENTSYYADLGLKLVRTKPLHYTPSGKTVNADL